MTAVGRVSLVRASSQEQSPAPDTPTPASSPTPNSSPSPPSGTGAAAWATLRHNLVRCIHCDTPVLAWSEQLAQEAADCAKTCPKGHTCDTNGAGENLYWQGSSGPLVEDEVAWDDAIQSWYGEEPSWNYMTHSSGDGGVVGHFTQVV